MDSKLSKAIVSKVADALLERHYGINLNDTYLSDDRCLDMLVESGDLVHKAINDIADDSCLDRIDCGFSFKAPLNIADEIAVMKEVLGEMVLGDDPVNCGKCGSRTDFKELGSPDNQLHFCLNTSCGNVFIAAAETVVTAEVV